MKFKSFEALKSLDVPTALEKKYAGIKAEMLASIPSQEQGLDMRRINDFFDGLGLKTPGLIVTDNEGLAQAKGIFEKNDYLERQDSYMRNIGSYLPELSLALVNHNYQFDKVTTGTMGG